MNQPLEQIATIVRGVTFAKSEGSSASSDGLLPVIRAGSIQEELLVNKDQIWIPANKIKKKQLIRKDDIVMCTSSGSADLVGKCAKAKEDWNGSFGAFCAGIRPKKEACDPSYLYHYLSSPQFRNWSKGSSGANIKNIRTSELAKFPVPDVPLPVQKRIAAILDKADSIRRKRQQAIKLANQFLRSVFLDMFGDPKVNPMGWDIKSLARACDDNRQITYGIVQAGPEFPGGVPYIKTGDFQNGRLRSGKYSLTSPEIAESYKRSQVHTDDLIYCIRASVGAVDMLPENLDGANLTQGTARIAPAPPFDPYFWLYQLRSKGFYFFINSRMKGATFKEITLTALREAPVVVPPYEEQKRFGDIARHMVDKIDVQTEKQSRQSEELIGSLNQRAFAGEL